ncbi:hypothetical protein BHE74_00017583 [Ensete ventricosum]|nr:hypothetical protein BHE74_00017583 [Ensete ventricosum]
MRPLLRCRTTLHGPKVIVEPAPVPDDVVCGTHVAVVACRSYLRSYKFPPPVSTVVFLLSHLLGSGFRFRVFVRMSSPSSSSSLSFWLSSRSSRMVEAANPSPRVVSHRTGNPRLVVVAGMSLGGVGPTGSKVAEALEAMKSCHNSDSTLTARRLAKIQERFHIPS